MVLHLGGEWFVPLGEVVAILHMPQAGHDVSQAFLGARRRGGEVYTVPEGKPRTMVIAVDGQGRSRVYLSPISAQTLSRRCATPHQQ